jgi:diguanylate cyclase (GGDEF)-like protein
LSRFSLLQRFGVLSVLITALLGVVLGHVLHSQIRRRALADAAQTAVLVSRFGIQPQLFPAELKDGISSEAAAALDDRLRTGYTTESVAGVVIWNRARRVVYSSHHPFRATAVEGDRALGAALGGHASATVEDHPLEPPVHGGIIKTYTPIQLTPGGAPDGAFAMYLFYAPVAARIRSETHTLYLWLIGGLLLLWAVLYRIVARASRALRREAARNEYQATHDPLTDLPNRACFYDRAEQATRFSRRYGSSAGIMVVDLDRFKEVNDTLGHQGGDALLRATADRLREAVRESDTVARIGGDEFAILLPEVAGADAALQLAGRLRETLEQPFVIDGLTVHVEGSIGVALYAEHGDDVETLIQHADAAMYLAKRAHSGAEVYAREEDESALSRLTILGELRRAIANQELVLHYQPQIELATGRIEAVEALVRWEHPVRGLLPPGEFIPAAEKSGLIKPLGSYVLRAAVRQCRAWLDAGVDLPVAVNLSSANFLDVDLPGEIATLLARWDVAPHQLRVEITESAIMSIPTRAVQVLAGIREIGVRLAIDDFGTGYSSLTYLQKLPVDELKIDRAFVSHIADTEGDAFIVSSAIDLGHNLGLKVVAEGVETGSQWNRLLELGCDVAQGFYAARPMPAADLLPWVGAWRRAPHLPPVAA